MKENVRIELKLPKSHIQKIGLRFQVPYNTHIRKLIFQNGFQKSGVRQSSDK